MANNTIAWGFNPGQRFVKNCTTHDGKRRDLRPFPAIIAPWQRSDDIGLFRTKQALMASVNGSEYIGGEHAERLPLGNRQMSVDRLDLDSPTYAALTQMSLMHTDLMDKDVLIATALPAEWRNDDAEKKIKRHIQDGLRHLAVIKGIIVQSEQNAVIFHEVLDDNGNKIESDTDLLTGLVCVGDLGGSTINRTVVDGLIPLPGQARSPIMGSRQVVEIMMQVAGYHQYIDAERRLINAVKNPGKDLVADSMLRQYSEAIISDFQRSWAIYKPVAYLFAGGTAHWVARDLLRAFNNARIVTNPQQAIAVGLWRLARRKLMRGV